MNADIQREPDTCAIIGAAMAVGLDYRRLIRSGNHLRPSASSAVHRYAAHNRIGYRGQYRERVAGVARVKPQISQMNADIQRDPATCAISGAAMAVGLDYRRLNRSGNHLRPSASSAVHRYAAHNRIGYRGQYRERVAGVARVKPQISQMNADIQRDPETCVITP
jgi:hypothetical protein